jgi:hypothetical protein
VSRLVIKTSAEAQWWRFWHRHSHWDSGASPRSKEPIKEDADSLLFAEHLFQFWTSDGTSKEQSWVQQSVNLPPNASTQDMSRRWSRTCKPSSSFVGGCGLSKRDIVLRSILSFLNSKTKDPRLKYVSPLLARPKQQTPYQMTGQHWRLVHPIAVGKES